jgi:hypothetical protein
VSPLASPAMSMMLLGFIFNPVFSPQSRDDRVV